MPYVKANRLRALATTGAKRWPALLNSELVKWAKVVRDAKIAKGSLQ